jgi:hypothetical protein
VMQTGVRICKHRSGVKGDVMGFGVDVGASAKERKKKKVKKKKKMMMMRSLGSRT